MTKPRGWAFRPSILLALSTVFLACNPYMAAVSVVSQSYGVATDERSFSTQMSDTEIEAEIKASLLQSPIQGTSRLTVYCRRGIVVIAGAVPPGSRAGITAVSIARGTSGVKRVETFFVDSDPSTTDDVELEGKIKAAFVADPSVTADQVSVSVFAGHVILVGVVNNPEQIDQFVNDARSVSGVASVRSYIQLVG